MSGRHPFENLTRDFGPERRARVDARKAELREALRLHELRDARASTPKAMGKAADTKLNPPPTSN